MVDSGYHSRVYKHTIPVASAALHPCMPVSSRKSDKGQMGDCQNYGPFMGPNLGDPKRDHNFDNPPDAGH